MAETSKDHHRVAPSTSEKALARRIRQHVNGKKHLFFAIVQPGFEETAASELRELGIEGCSGAVGGGIEGCSGAVEGGVEFSSKLDGCYRVNLASRTITRLLMRLTSFRATDFPTLNQKISDFPWELHVKEGTPLSFRIRTKGSRLHHGGRIEEMFRSEIRSRLGKFNLGAVFSDRTPRDSSSPKTQSVQVRLDHDRCLVSLDTTGGPLHKRGRKPYTSKASLRETLASLILREAGWPHYDFLIDPMCGSGTFAMEAYEMMTGRLPNAEREFSFMQWPAFRPAAYRHLVKQLREEAQATKGHSGRILSSDIDPEAVKTAKKNMAAAGLSDGLDPSLPQVSRRDFFGPEGGTSAVEIPDHGSGLIVLNPPYGKRLGDRDAGRIFRKMGEVIRKHDRCGYAIIVPGLEYEKILSLGHDKKILFMNGGIRVSVIIKRRPGG